MYEPHRMRVLKPIPELDALPGDYLTIHVGSIQPVVVVRYPRTASLSCVAGLIEGGILESENPMPDYVREALDVANPGAAPHLRLV